MGCPGYCNPGADSATAPVAAFLRLGDMDKRLDKVKQHFDILINDQKFKVISCKMDQASSILSIKTKIFGQTFPHNGRFAVIIPTQNTTHDLSVVFRSMSKGPCIEHWEYTIEAE